MSLVYKLYNRKGHTVLLKILQHSNVDGVRANVVGAYIDMVFQGSNLGALPVEWFTTPWGVFQMSDRKNSQMIHMRFKVASCAVPRSHKRLQWMIDNPFDERVKAFIQELDSHRVDLEIIQDLLELSRFDIIEILDRTWFDAFGTSPMLPTEPIDHIDYKVDTISLKLNEERSLLLDGIRKKEEE